MTRRYVEGVHILVDVKEYEDAWWDAFRKQGGKGIVTDPLGVIFVARLVVAFCALAGQGYQFQWEKTPSHRIVFNKTNFTKANALKRLAQQRTWYETHGYHHPSVLRLEV